MKTINMRMLFVIVISLFFVNAALAGADKSKSKPKEKQAQVKNRGAKVAVPQRAPSTKKTFAQKKKKEKQATNIQEAMDKSRADQSRLRKQEHERTDKRIQSWDTRSSETIEIKQTGNPVIDMGHTDPSMDMGEDESGLVGLHSHVEEDATDIDFDEELREVSSVKKKKTPKGTVAKSPISKNNINAKSK